jgi:hypothetical protein
MHGGFNHPTPGDGGEYIFEIETKNPIPGQAASFAKNHILLAGIS